MLGILHIAFSPDRCLRRWCSPDLGLQSTGGLLLSVGLLLKYPLLPQLLMLLLRTADTIFISLVGLTTNGEKMQREREPVSIIKPISLVSLKQ